MLKEEKPLSIIFDNEKELAHPQKMTKNLNTAIYFAKPYHSWDLGTNENRNGLISQFLPKSAPFDKVTDEEIQAIEDNLNNRSRKIFGYRTPLEIKSRFGYIALQT